MDFIGLAVIGSLIGTAAIVLVFIYLYFLYRERYIGIWALSWLILLSRYAIFDSGLLTWKQSTVGLTIYQLLIFLSIILFVWGTYLFANRPMNMLWIYSTITILVVTLIINLVYSHLTYTLLVPILFGSGICIVIGMIFIKYLNLKGIGRLTTGWAYILWGLLNLTMPFTINLTWFAPWGYLAGGILRLLIAIGTLMVYFEKTRNDLESKEAQYRLLAENAIDVIYYLKTFPQTKLEYLSPSVFTVSGHKAEDFYSNPELVFSLIHPDDRSLLNDFLSTPACQNHSLVTLRIVRNDNTTIWVEQKCLPIYDKDGNIVAIEGIVRDITVRKELEEMTSLFDRMNMIGNMAATVAHEIRNPMTTIRGYLQLMQRKHAYQNDRDKFALMIEEIDRANAIIQEYLSLSKNKHANFEPCSLNDIITNLFPLIEANATAANIYAAIELAEIPKLPLDKNEIRQLLLNLVRNAIEAMTAGRKVTIRTYQEAGKIVLAVSDQGSGIPQHILDNLGTPFVTTKATGTGLGIPICYQIAHRHHAQIRIATGTEGTTFYINFKNSHN